MILFDKVWYLPDGERHLQEWMTQANRRVAGRLTYQFHKYEAARREVKHRRVSVDIGAHAGLWSYWLARDFETVHAFEPKPEHQECWLLNVPQRPGVHLHPIALGAAPRHVNLVTGPNSSGDTRISLEDMPGTIPMQCLDEFELQDVDFMKIDAEGYEVFILEGARETLKRCRPVVIVEQKRGHGKHFGRDDLAGVSLLEQLGAKRVWDQAGDYVLTFPGVAK